MSEEKKRFNLGEFFSSIKVKPPQTKWCIAILGVLFILTIVGVAFVYPYQGYQQSNFSAEDSQFVYATVTSDPNTSARTVSATLEDGKNVSFTADYRYLAMMHKGDPVILQTLIKSSFTNSYYIFYDFNRNTGLIVLFAIFLLAICVIARLKGIASIFGLGISVAVILLFTIPALLAGQDALLIGLLTCSAVMFAVLFVTHGFSMKTGTAMLGTLAGLLVSSGLAMLAMRFLFISGASSDNATFLGTTVPSLSLKSVALCGMIIAALGVLNDVTITQAAIVTELRTTTEMLARKDIFVSAMRIGKDHIASTVYTLTFAYVGCSLPQIMWIYIQANATIGEKITSYQIVGELASSLVGCIGLVLAIPLTTFIATFVVPKPEVVAPLPPPPLPDHNDVVPLAKSLVNPTGEITLAR